LILQRGKFKRSDIKTNERLLILGRTGTGKSVLFDTMLNYLSKKCYIILIDTKNEYTHYPTLDFKTFYTQNRGIARINELKVKTKQGTFQTDDLYKIAEFICSNLYNFNKKAKDENRRLRHTIVCIEELGNVCKKGGRLYDVMEHTSKIVSQGRSLEIGFIGTSQRPQMVHTDFIAEADHLISFAVSSKHDLEAMRSYFAKEQYYELKLFEFFHYQIKKGIIKHCYPIYETEMYHSLDYYRKLFGRS